MSALQKSECYHSGGYGNEHKDKAQGLFRLGVLDFTCYMHLRSDTYYSCLNQFKNQNQNKNLQRSGLPELRSLLESIIKHRKDKGNGITEILYRRYNQNGFK